jgi:ferredoxin-NADP reductase
VARDADAGWRPARVIDNRPAADGSMWITFEAADGLPACYEPGHVIGLAVPVDQGQLRRAYTVSRSDHQSRQFSLLYRVIAHGRMSPRLAALPRGATVFFHGRFHTPIHQEIQPDAERIVLMATGVGIGPIFGYAQKALAEGETRPIRLYGGFRKESDICLATDLEALAQGHANFEWYSSLTHPPTDWRGLTGRLTARVADAIDTRQLETHHVHLVGNGEMVHLVRQALYRAGMPAKRVSIETYFNHYVEPLDEAIETLARRLGAFKDPASRSADVSAAPL